MPLDIGVGILLALGVAESFGREATPWFVILGIVAALLPDIDILTIPFLGKWYHRTHTHFPLVYVPLSVLAFLVLDPMYATLLVLGVYAHLIHDTFGIGWGIAWLWPFSKRTFLFLPAEGRDGPVHWLRYYYLRPNPLAYIEYGTLLAALIALALYFT